MVISVRRATAGDQAAITGLVRRARLNPAGLAWPGFVVAEQDGRLVGAAQLRRHPDDALELASLVVEPPARTAGVATSMVDALLEPETTAVYTIIDRRFTHHFARWGFAPAAPAELPPSVRRTLRIGRLVTGVASTLRRPRIRLVPLARPATADRAVADT
jgi:N-acetylglutamate synthase-like GNAT family acetyltransferase